MSEEDTEWEKKYDRYNKEFKGLSCRALNCFFSYCDYSANEYRDSDEYDTAEKVRVAIKSGKLHPKVEPRPRNYGWATHIEVCKFLGLPHPRKGEKAKKLKQLEEQVRKLKQEMVEEAEEEEMQRLFNENLIEYAAKALKPFFKTPAPLPTLRKPE